MERFTPFLPLERLSNGERKIVTDSRSTVAKRHSDGRFALAPTIRRTLDRSAFSCALNENSIDGTACRFGSNHSRSRRFLGLAHRISRNATPVNGLRTLRVRFAETRDSETRAPRKHAIFLTLGLQIPSTSTAFAIVGKNPLEASCKAAPADRL
ncbi:hypothetical protein LJR230_001788 [Trinickia sp. LjRoot230]|uniref:hypothetical protein n=1 Tax=Trinickia sp. LjRoot230 TaxID=3342288 RepID=UPI003ECDDD4A